MDPCYETRGSQFPRTVAPNASDIDEGGNRKIRLSAQGIKDLETDIGATSKRIGIRCFGEGSII